MKLIYECLYCGTRNFTTVDEIEEYVECSKCRGLHDIEINDDGEIIVEEF